MTSLTKPVRRKTQREYRVLFTEARKIVVTLAPGDVIEFREAGRREIFALPIDFAFKSAVKLKADAKMRAKKEARKSKLTSR